MIVTEKLKPRFRWKSGVLLILISPYSLVEKKHRPYPQSDAPWGMQCVTILDGIKFGLPWQHQRGRDRDLVIWHVLCWGGMPGKCFGWGPLGSGQVLFLIWRYYLCVVRPNPNHGSIFGGELVCVCDLFRENRYPFVIEILANQPWVQTSVSALLYTHSNTWPRWKDIRGSEKCRESALMRGCSIFSVVVSYPVWCLFGPARRSHPNPNHGSRVFSGGRIAVCNLFRGNSVGYWRGPVPLSLATGGFVDNFYLDAATKEDSLVRRPSVGQRFVSVAHIGWFGHFFGIALSCSWFWNPGLIFYRTP